MKEKIWIEKLIELLNEYEKTLEPNLQIEWTEVWIKSTPEIVISKKFWFIKWLVENDKIRMPHELDELPQIYWVDYNSNECKSDRLIMLLFISDTPIEDLISYLK
jgi:hypothetical protein